MSDVIRLEFDDENPVLELVIQQPETISLELADVLRGPPGPSGGETLVWQQTLALATWTIPHNLRRFPTVVVVDGLGSVVVPDVRYVDENIVQITHGSPFAGTAYLN